VLQPILASLSSGLLRARLVPRYAIASDTATAATILADISEAYVTVTKRGEYVLGSGELRGLADPQATPSPPIDLNGLVCGLKIQAAMHNDSRCR